MAVIQMNFFSEALQLNTDVTIILPTPNDMELGQKAAYFVEGAKYQVLYLLHGTYADHNDWIRSSNITRYAQEHKVMVVCPNGGNSYWQDMHIGPKYFTYLTEELPRFVRTIFPVSGKREDTFIGGLSMGAFGALNAAFRYPEKYASVIAMSLGMKFCTKGSHPANGSQPWPWEAILPPPYDAKGTGLDDGPILEALVSSGTKIPRIYLAVGTEDFNYEKISHTRKFMDTLGVEYTYEEGPGAHDWTFWDQYIQRGLDWLNLKGTTLR